MDLNVYKTDHAKDQGGTWIDLGDGAQLRVASVQNAAYKKAIRKRLSGVPSHMLKADPDLQDKIIGDAIAEFVLLGWKGMTEGGKTIEPTLENRKRAMALPHFRELVAEYATDISNFQTEDEASDVAAVKSSP